MRKTRACLIAALLLGRLSPPAHAVSIREARASLLAGTLDYLNAVYLWGGMHPDTGLDCSGFVRLVYAQSGFYLPRSSTAQYAATVLEKPRNVLPGDLIFFSMSSPGSRRVDHVGIYLGRGYFIHASVRSGVHIERIADPYFMSRVVAFRKYKGF